MPCICCTRIATIWCDEDKVLIVDEHRTDRCRIAPGNAACTRWSRSRKAARLRTPREQLARFSYQRFFRRYLRLGGDDRYGPRSQFRTLVGLRTAGPGYSAASSQPAPGAARQVYPRAQEKWAAIIASVTELQTQGRPVLIGTGSVADSELLSRKLTVAGIAHRVLNARQDRQEAEIVAAAGKRDR